MIEFHPLTPIGATVAEPKPRFCTWDRRGSLVGFVVSLNLRRRHLTAGQRACVAVEMLPGLEKEARERQRGGQGGVLLSQQIDEAKGRSDQKAAAIVGVNRQYVSDAKKLKEERPELFQEVRAGVAIRNEELTECQRNF